MKSVRKILFALAIPTTIILQYYQFESNDISIIIVGNIDDGSQKYGVDGGSDGTPSYDEHHYLHENVKFEYDWNLFNLAKSAIIPDDDKKKNGEKSDIDIVGWGKHSKENLGDFVIVMNNSDVYGPIPDLRFSPNDKKNVRDALLNHTTRNNTNSTAGTFLFVTQVCKAAIDCVDAHNEWEAYYKQQQRYNKNNTSNQHSNNSSNNRTSMSLKLSKPDQPKCPPHVLLSHFNENWGGLSSYIENRTMNWGNLINSWKKWGCGDARNESSIIRQYLDLDELKGIITVQHQILNHPKVTSLPLGIDQEKSIPMIANILNQTNNKHNTNNKTMCPNNNTKKWLTINNSGGVFRKQINEMVMKNFPQPSTRQNKNDNMTSLLKNTYDQKRDMQSLYDEMKCSRFVLCPPGVGYDAYRIWEVLALGSIPILERNVAGGFENTLDELPVLWVDNYDNVTPELLQRSYYNLVVPSSTQAQTQKNGDYNKNNNYNHLTTTKWWIDNILYNKEASAVESSSKDQQEISRQDEQISVLNKDHPYNYKRLTKKWWIDYITSLLDE